MSAAAFQVLRALRPKQWTKNAIVLAPLVFAMGDPSQHLPADATPRALAATLLFCIVSSAIYILNDLRDIELDRAHPVKRQRPFASGALSPRTGWLLMTGLLAAGVGASFLLDRAFAWVICGYVALQALYTFGLKRLALVDIVIIATGFVLRALAGGVVIHVLVSPWLLVCTMLLALFLALCKRRHELVTLQGGEGQTRPSLRAYDQRLLDALVPSVAVVTLLAYSLYTQWPDTVAKFGSRALGFTIPFVLFGLARYLHLVYRREQGGRPEQTLLTDVPLLLNIALYGATVLGLLLWR
jgi:4-hydroxybenzoate polyprenyltransferase